MTLTCEDVCKECKKNFLKDPDKLGDYEEGGSLLRFCPVCGQMLPYLSIDYKKAKLDISRNEKKRIGVRIAKVKNLDYIVMSAVIKDLKEVSNQKEFITKFMNEIRSRFNIDMLREEIKEFI